MRLEGRDREKMEEPGENPPGPFMVKTGKRERESAGALALAGYRHFLRYFLDRHLIPSFLDKDPMRIRARVLQRGPNHT